MGHPTSTKSDRVVLLAPAPELGLSGVTSYLDCLAPALARRGQEVVLIRIRPGSESGIRLARVGRFLRVTCTYEKVASVPGLIDRALGRGRVMAIHSHDDSLLGLASLLARERKANAFHTVHYVHPTTAEQLGVHRPFVISVSVAVAVELPVASRILRPFAEVRWNVKYGLAERARRVRLGLQIGDGEQLILFAGRANSPTKGADLLLEAVEMIGTAHRRPVRLVFAGPFWMPPNARQVGQRNWAGIVTVGVLSRPRLFALYRAADVVAVPSRYEPFGLVALEAQTVGTPVVAAAIGGLTEVVHPEIGRLVPLESGSAPIEALADAIEDVLRGPTYRRELADWTLRTFPEQRHVETLLTMYRRSPIA